MNLWDDHHARRHIFGDWTAINLIAWGLIYALLFALIGLGAMLIA